MSTPVCIKRMRRERETLENHRDSDYCVHFPDDNLLHFTAYILGPEDSLYRHKFVKLQIDIPENYPLTSPKVKFIQHSGGRIHPNLYVEGKVCLSILGTWSGEPWATSMTVESILITLRSLLDNEPFKHEPGQKDDPAYNSFVQYSTWQSLLLDYMHHEKAPELRAFMDDYIHRNRAKMVSDLEQQGKQNASVKSLSCKYPGSMSKPFKADYTALIAQVKTLCAASKASPRSEKSPDSGVPSAPIVISTEGQKPVAGRPDTKPGLKRKTAPASGADASSAIDVESIPKKRKRAFLDVVDLT